MKITLLELKAGPENSALMSALAIARDNARRLATLGKNAITLTAEFDP
ncbi:hypothetical protein [Mesorhizobium sp.]|nr:hypothetical protein [Mesorhizobium sp.]